LIWDRARIHTSKKVRTYLSGHPEIEVELLPAYSPELKPGEYCHGNAKQNLKNARPTRKSEMRSYWIGALLACNINMTSCSVSFTEQVFLLGNSG
jgi:transposase